MKASAKPSPVTGTTVTLAALATDDGGAANLKYTWAATALPAGVSVPVFTINATNAAKNTTATLSGAGTYRFAVSIADTAGLMATSSVNVSVKQSLASVTISPASINIKVGGTQQFMATAKDQFGQAHGLAAEVHLDIDWRQDHIRRSLHRADGDGKCHRHRHRSSRSSSSGNTTVSVIPPNTAPQVITAASGAAHSGDRHHGGAFRPGHRRRW